MVTYIFTGLGLISLIAFLIKRDKKSSIVAIALKTVTSLMFISAAVASAIYSMHSNPSTDFSRLVPVGLFVLGLVFGMVGDILLDFKIYFKALNMRFLCLDHDTDVLMLTGMSSFGFGHILYITALAILNSSSLINLLYSCAIGLALIALVMFMSIKVMKMDFRKFLISSIIYGFLLGTFVIYSLFNVVGNPSIENILLLVGSIFFIVSDLILSITYFSKKEDYEKSGMFNPESKFMIIANHVTYYVAQFLIAISIMFI